MCSVLLFSRGLSQFGLLGTPCTALLYSTLRIVTVNYELPSKDQFGNLPLWAQTQLQKGFQVDSDWRVK